MASSPRRTRQCPVSMTLSVQLGTAHLARSRSSRYEIEGTQRAVLCTQLRLHPTKGSKYLSSKPIKNRRISIIIRQDPIPKALGSEGEFLVINKKNFDNVSEDKLLDFLQTEEDETESNNRGVCGRASDFKPDMIERSARWLGRTWGSRKT